MDRVFGYGSLVNHHTHDNRPVEPARITGWRREWVGTRLRPAAFLSVRPVAGAEIAGLWLPVPGGDWAALDERERAYDRHPLTNGAQVYAVTPGLREDTVRHPILLSYLDVVVEGFHLHFGFEGVAAFFDTTDCWDHPVEDDRAAPVYPRARPVTAELRALTDRHLAAV